MALTNMQEHLANDLFTVGAVLFDTEKGFALKHHEEHPDWPQSPIYLNLRTNQHPVPEKRGPLTPQNMEWIGIEMYNAVKLRMQWHFDLFADIPEAGTPFGDQIQKQFALSDGERLQLIKEVRADGTRRISGVKRLKGRPGDKVLLVDDLITGAATKLEAIKVLEDAGYKVIGIIVLVDRCQGGVEELRVAGYRVHAVMTLPDMLDYYVRREFITPGMRDLVLAYPRTIRALQAVT